MVRTRSQARGFLYPDLDEERRLNKRRRTDRANSIDDFINDISEFLVPLSQGSNISLNEASDNLRGLLEGISQPNVIPDTATRGSSNPYKSSDTSHRHRLPDDSPYTTTVRTHVRRKEYGR